MNIVKRAAGFAAHLDVGAGSIIGTREYQQDYGYLYTDSDSAFGILCDGMGGLNGGERASRTAVEILAEDYEKKRPREQILPFFEEEIAKADREVAALKNREGKRLKAGTTMVAALICQERLSYLSVGDSKIYLIRGGEILALTPEHNYRLKLHEDLKSGAISPKEYELQINTPKAEALISFIGMNGVARAELYETKLEDGDIVLLCSDGLYKCMNSRQIFAMVRDNDLDMEIAADRLLRMSEACAGRSQDNTTVILMKYQKQF